MLDFTNYQTIYFNLLVLDKSSHGLQNCHNP